MIAEVAFALLALTSPTGSASDGSPDVSTDDFHPIVRVEVERSTSKRRSPTASSSFAQTVDQVPDRCFIDLSDPNFRCALTDTPRRNGDEADLEPGDILRAAREVGMPALKLQVQPRGGTLVNVETIFYTSPRVLRRTVVLLGSSVRLEATPVRFTWVHGDGTSHATSRPGRPYPAKDVTHRYRQPGEDVRARVDTTYRVRYSVDGGSWATLDETLTAPGPGTSFDIDEAAPVLTD